MATNKKSFGQRLQDFMLSYRGKVIMNYAYSWGAAIVIAGTLFKLTHLPGANLMLWLGMGTEVLVFFLSAFDLPQKTNNNPQFVGGGGNVVIGNGEISSGSAAITGGNAGGGVVIIGGGNVASSAQAENVTSHADEPIFPITAQKSETIVVSGGDVSNEGVVSSPSVSPISPVTIEMEETTQAYVDKLKEMTEMLSHFTTQAESLAQDADQMLHLKQNLAGINAIYEMQLRSASAQMGTIDQVHEETRKMARQIEELNLVYARMLQAMQAKGN